MFANANVSHKLLRTVCNNYGHGNQKSRKVFKETKLCDLNYPNLLAKNTKLICEQSEITSFRQNCQFDLVF